ncbi:cyclic nucleotide-binding domain protein (macronuclear) [Tetrahymena thermophila SB210]|uniref:Cyclic nucleotide-binding domain protein n=1 Tax=Tetrahymena thermophila (strain SB210) TaxID=312017 RepID=Q22RC2_TETTS|nr:cyclic nucleotide-binding domain protein [Tetrahymena thermophila SB210]EAR88200.2 cyclic nucleotide-binding domain protein [Tetrahymena thermophila SB210]|eukprot:XP_001008445.2 cyclic nucleotide-binding domain protein [Tetrahymena thermophila SB210]
MDDPQQDVDAQTIFIKKKLFSSAFGSPVSQRNSLVQFYSISQQNYQQNNQMDTIRQLFNRPAEAILEKFNQKKLGSISIIKRDSVYKVNSSAANDFSKDYSIEISKNNIFPSPDNNYLEMILLKQPQQRKIKELEFVQECLKQLEIFQSWHENQSMQCSDSATIEQQLEEEYQNLLIYKYINYRSYTKYECIFNQDEPSRECFTIFKGQALVLQKAHSKKDQKSEFQILQILHLYDISREEYDKISELFPHQIITGKIKEGRLFGEIELYFKEPRAMTVLCISDHMGVGYFDLKSFKLTLQAQVNRQKDMLLEFFKKMSLFKGVQENYLKILVSKCEVVKKNIKALVYKQNDPIDYVYFIISGEVELTHVVNSVKLNNLSKSRDNSTDKAMKSFEKSYHQVQNQESEDFYDIEKDIIANVKEAIQLNMFYKPQKRIIQNNTNNLDNQIEKHLKQLQYLAEEKQYNYINAKNNTKSKISTILGQYEIFGEQLEDYEKRNNTAKIISSSVKLARIKSSVFFDIIVNQFSKLYPQIDIIKALQIKNKQFQKHKEQKMIPRDQILVMIQTQQKIEIQNDQYKKYEAEVSSTSLQAVLENIFQQKKLSTNKKKKEIKNDKNNMNNMCQQQDNNYSSQKNFRTRVLSSHNQQDSDQDSLNPSSPVSTAFSTQKVSYDEVKDYKFKLLNQQTGGESKSSNKLFNNQRDQPSSFTPVDITFDKNVIRGHTSQSKQRGSLSSFSSAFNNSINQTNITQNQLSSKITNQETNSNFLMSNSTNGLSSPKSSKISQRPYSKSTQFYSKSATNKDSIKFDFSSLQVKKSLLQIPTSPLNINIQHQDNNQNIVQSSSEFPKDKSDNNKSYKIKLNPTRRSKSNPHSSNSNVGEINQQQQQQQQQKLNEVQNISNKNSNIFDVLYPNIVNQVNRQIGVLKSCQQLSHADPKLTQVRKPCINTLHFNTSKEREINQNLNSPNDKKVQINQTKTLGRFFTPQKASEKLMKSKEIGLDPLTQQQEQEKQAEKQDIELLSQQMCITYKHLRLDKMFPKSQQTKKAQQYFKESANEFKAKINFDKMQIKIKNQPVSYIDYIEQKFILTPQKHTEDNKDNKDNNNHLDNFNFIQKNIS